MAPLVEPTGGHVEIVKAQMDYGAHKADELSFRRGEDIAVISQARDPGWVIAENSFGQRGLAPQTHLLAVSPGESASFFPSAPHGTEAIAPSVMQGVVRVASRVYEALHPDELSLQRGQQIAVQGPAPDQGWLQATLNGVEGLVPETHLLPPANTTRVAARNYDAMQSDELSFEVGDIIGVVGAVPGEAGWYQVSGSTGSLFHDGLRFHRALAIVIRCCGF